MLMSLFIILLNNYLLVWFTVFHGKFGHILWVSLRNSMADCGKSSKFCGSLSPPIHNCLLFRY